MSQASESEPDFTPLLDVVLQLLMFFIMVVRFVPNQGDSELIKLPDAHEGHLLDMADRNTIFLNLRPFDEKYFRQRYSEQEWDNFPKDRFQPGEPCILLFSKNDWPYNLVGLRQKLKDTFADAQRAAGGGEVQTVVIIRADKDTEYSTVYAILKDCKDIGFRKLKLRAFKTAGE